MCLPAQSRWGASSALDAYVARGPFSVCLQGLNEAQAYIYVARWVEQHPGADLLASEALQHIVLAYFNERTRLLLCVERLLDLALGERVWHSTVVVPLHCDSLHARWSWRVAPAELVSVPVRWTFALHQWVVHMIVGERVRGVNSYRSQSSSSVTQIVISLLPCR